MAKPDYTIKQLEPDPHDTRLIERHLGEGRVKATAFEKYLSSLSDLADNAEQFEVVLGEDPDAGDQAEQTD